MFECKTLGDYHDLYDSADLLLLANVFEKLYETGFREYKLDPAHYCTSPGVNWNAYLKPNGT